jgi:hypothetical protein
MIRCKDGNLFVEWRIKPVQEGMGWQPELQQGRPLVIGICQITTTLLDSAFPSLIEMVCLSGDILPW